MPYWPGSSLENYREKSYAGSNPVSSAKLTPEAGRLKDNSADSSYLRLQIFDLRLMRLRLLRKKLADKMIGKYIQKTDP